MLHVRMGMHSIYIYYMFDISSETEVKSIKCWFLQFASYSNLRGFCKPL